MSESNGFDNFNNNSDTAAENAVSDTYVTESSEELYRTPDLTSDVAADAAEEKQEDQRVEELIDYAGNAVDGMTAHVENEFQENQTAQNDNPYQHNNSYEEQNVSGGSPYNNNAYSAGAHHDNSPYGNNAYNEQNVQNSSPYSNNPYGNSAYSEQNMQNGSPYSNNPYGNDVYNGQSMQNSSPYNNNPYGNGAYNGQNGSPYNNNPYGNGAYGGQNAQNGNSYGNASYSGQTAQNNYQNPYGTPPYGNGNSQYSPYAVPTKKNTGLIVGIVIGIMALFLIAVFALAYKVVDLYTSENNKKRSTREEYNFDDDEWEYDQKRDDYYNDGDHHYDDHYFDDYYDDYYDDYFNDDYGDYYDDYFGSGNNGDGGNNIENDKYYSLHDEIRNDLTYSVKLEDYKYDTTYENVDIQVTYPVIEGNDVPNLDKLNSVIKDEADFITEYFEEEYQDYMMDDSDYFTALSIGYVTYMDEEKLSIAFSEHMYSDYYDDVFLYCINIDMENGIVLDNESLLGIDDDFSVDFRRRSDIQNGEISYLTMMTDQEITRHFKSTDIIVFYIPQGMEIGFNYDAGWVTVTYEDYEKYLKVF